MDDDVEGARTFAAEASAYDSFMGRWSTPLAELFADAAGVRPGSSALDVGCGPGALTAVLAARLGAGAVSACDPSPGFLRTCGLRHPGVTARPGRAEALPFADGTVDHALAQLVLHFVSDPVLAATEMARVVRPRGVVAACVWDFADGMQLLRTFWDAALALDEEAPDEARTLRFGRPREIAGLFEGVGLEDVVESALEVSSTYRSFDELWGGFLGGVGPAGAYCTSLSEVDRTRLRSELFHRLGSPRGHLTLVAVARCAVARVPA